MSKKHTGQCACGSVRFDTEPGFISAARVRQLPIAEIELTLTAAEGTAERTIGTYTLVHEGLLQR